MEVATHQWNTVQRPGFRALVKDNLGPVKVPATIAKQSSGSIMMPPPSCTVDLSTRIRREAELESMNYQVPPAATQRFGAEAIGTNERWQHGLTCGRHDDSRPLGVRQMDWEHTAIVNRPATSQQVPLGSGPESAQCIRTSDTADRAQLSFVGQPLVIDLRTSPVEASH